MPLPPSGILNVAKPPGVTSRRVVDRVQKLVRPAKAGHAGTLDPLAVGVLVVCIGQATRLIDYVQRMPKTYEATFLLGRTSDTEDVDGLVTELLEPLIPTTEQIAAAAEKFVGTVMQRPPAYSALKVQGRRAYDLARAGEEVTLAARPIEIYAIELTGYRYPELRLRVRCGSGTYVRSLGRDLAESLGTGAVIERALVRTAIGGFRLEEACELEDLTAEVFAARLQPPSTAVAGRPSVVVDEHELRTLNYGQPIEKSSPVETDELIALTEDGRLASILEPAAAGRWKPRHNFAVG
ncbi:MAG: tRNA pseudouridine(55) synthase TruB [Pirellulales bacterium]